MTTAAAAIKAELRQAALARRRAVGEAARTKFSVRLAREGLRLAKSFQARAVSAFRAFPDEPDTAPLLAALAEGQASRFTQLEGAYQQAPEVTRRRLYMDTIENVLSRAHKVLIDGHAGNNLIYLPIDKILEKSAGRDDQTSEPASGSSSKEPESVTVEARGRGER